MLSRAEALYARAAIVRAEIEDLAEGLRRVVDDTYGSGDGDERARNLRRSIGARTMLANAQVEQLRDIAYELAQVWEWDDRQGS